MAGKIKRTFGFALGITAGYFEAYGVDGDPFNWLFIESIGFTSRFEGDLNGSWGELLEQKCRAARDD